eukprot:m51a1_g6950 hypothetical protein (428) ;mRNA; f:25314-26672
MLTRLYALLPCAPLVLALALLAAGEPGQGDIAWTYEGVMDWSIEEEAEVNAVDAEPGELVCWSLPVNLGLSDPSANAVHIAGDAYDRVALSPHGYLLLSNSKTMPDPCSGNPGVFTHEQHALRFPRASCAGELLRGPYLAVDAFAYRVFLGDTIEYATGRKHGREMMYFEFDDRGVANGTTAPSTPKVILVLTRHAVYVQFEKFKPTTAASFPGVHIGTRSAVQVVDALCDAATGATTFRTDMVAGTTYKLASPSDGDDRGGPGTPAAAVVGAAVGGGLAGLLILSAGIATSVWLHRRKRRVNMPMEMAASEPAFYAVPASSPALSPQQHAADPSQSPVVVGMHGGGCDSCGHSSGSDTVLVMLPSGQLVPLDAAAAGLSVVPVPMPVAFPVGTVSPAPFNVDVPDVSSAGGANVSGGKSTCSTLSL